MGNPTINISDPLLSHFVNYHIASVTQSGGGLAAVVYTDCQAENNTCPLGKVNIQIRGCPRPPCA
jgi:hypothetical protein